MRLLAQDRIELLTVLCAAILANPENETLTHEEILIEANDLLDLIVKQEK